MMGARGGFAAASEAAVPTNEKTETPEALAESPAPPAGARAGRAGALVVRLLFDLLVIDAAVESWLAGSPIRTGLAAGAVLYFALTVYVVSKGGRFGGRGWLMDPLMGAIVFLGFLVACSWTKAWTVTGIVAIRQPAPAVLAATMGGLALLAAVRMAGPGGARSWWIRVPMLAVSLYAIAGFGRGIASRTPVVELLQGHGFWSAAPWWLQGTWIGSFVILPLAFLRELGASIARLSTVPYLRWMFVFALGCWVAFNVAGL